MTGEVCDDGDVSNFDKCDQFCTGPVSGWQCIGGTSTSASTCSEICGDGVKTGSEQCDDGSITSLDGCSNLCAVESGWSCTGSPSVCTSFCGDGMRVSSEICDDGDNDPLSKCLDDCSGNAPGWACTGGTPTTASTCTEVCGDSILTISEQCDDNNFISGDGCSSLC